MKIIELEILTDDLEKTATFYADQLGLDIKNRSQNSLSFIIGHSTFIFKRTEPANQPNPRTPRYHVAFNIPCNKIKEAAEWLSAFTTIIANPDGEMVTDFQNWHARAIYFYDLNGNILEFIARSDLKNESEKPFSAASIHCISEIGLVVDDPLTFAATLVDQDLPYFAKGPKREDFVALGDDNGLLIITTPTRNWYPTDQPAQKHFVSMQVLTNNNRREITLDGDGSKRQ